MYIENPVVVVSDKIEDGFVVYGDMKYGSYNDVLKQSEKMA